MIKQSEQKGLIVSTSPEATPAWQELVSHCDWPALLAANARRVHKQFALVSPACVLFWLETTEQLKPTAKLIEWTRSWRAELPCVVLAGDVPDRAESIVRSAGAHVFLSDDGTRTSWSSLPIFVEPECQEAGDRQYLKVPPTPSDDRTHLT